MILDRVDGPTVLDLGCVQHDLSNVDSDDWLHGRLADEFDTVIGVDYLPDAVLELHMDGYDVCYANVETMDLDVEADTVVAGELIEHVANPGLMLERISEHIKTNGKLVLTTPNPWAAVHLRRLLTDNFSINEEHVAWYGPQTIRQLLQRYGFKVTEMTTTTRNHRGLTGLAQKLGSDIFGGTTWVVTANVA